MPLAENLSNVRIMTLLKCWYSAAYVVPASKLTAGFEGMQISGLSAAAVLVHILYARVVGEEKRTSFQASHRVLLSSLRGCIMINSKPGEHGILELGLI